MLDDLINKYQEWLYGFIDLSDKIDRYSQLLIYLSGKKFTWSVRHDGNRAEDGYALRENFASAFGLNEDFWVDRMPEHCSMLEMMIALSIRADDIVYTPEEGERTAYWFWEMVDNMGLDEMDKFGFDRIFCDEIIDQFLNHRYLRDGRGGLFRTRNPKIDMRKSEIWYQMNVWLEENFE